MSGPKLAKVKARKAKKTPHPSTQGAMITLPTHYVRALYLCCFELAGLLDDQLTAQGVTNARATLKQADDLEQLVDFKLLKKIDPDYTR